jgi:hypothetical protein
MSDESAALGDDEGGQEGLPSPLPLAPGFRTKRAKITLFRSSNLTQRTQFGVHILLLVSLTGYNCEPLATFLQVCQAQSLG